VHLLAVLQGIVIFAKIKMQETEIKYMQEALSRDVIVRLCEECGLSLAQAMQTLYSSSVYQQLQNPQTHIFSQSSVYVYDCLEQEIKYGKVVAI